MIDRAHRRLLVILFCLFVAAIALRLHGYSISCFTESLHPGSRHPENLIGHGQGIRSDDWAYEGPLIWSQVAHRPKFPVINENLGLKGENVLAPTNCPVNHFVGLFKPVTWGFFLGGDRGLSWKWYSVTLGLFYACFLVLLLVTEGRFRFAVLGSLILVYSPFFQFWSLHKAEILIHGLLAFVGLVGLLHSSHKRWILAAGMLCGWSAACFVIDMIYPPFQVNIGQFLVFFVPAFLWTQWDRARLRQRAGWRAAGLLLAIAIVGAAGFAFLKAAGSAVALINATTYPGQRFATGGGEPIILLFTNNYVVSALAKNWDYLGNICESATFLFFSPVVLLIYLAAWMERRRGFDVLSLALFAYLLWNIAFVVVGFPVWLAKLTLTSKMPGNRIAMGMGIADLILVLRFLGRDGELREKLSTRAHTIVLAVWALLLVWGAYRLYGYIGTPKSVKWLLVVLANFGLGYLLITPRRETAFLACLLVGSLAYTVGFNPIVRGGLESMRELSLSRRMLEADEQAGGQSKWITFAAHGKLSYTSATNQLPRILGLHSFDGVHVQPEFELWRYFDPQGQSRHLYNQIGYVDFQPASGEPVRFEATLGHLIVHADPASPIFWRLGLTHILVDGGDLAPYPERYFQRLSQDGERTILKLVYPRPAR